VPAATRATRWAVLALLAAGLALHLAGLAGRSLNTDEVYYPLAAREGRLLSAMRADVHPPLEPLLVGAMARAGLPETAWRVLSVLAWLGAACFAAMALVLTSPQGALLARLVRSYALAVFFGAWSIDRFVALIDAPNRRRMFSFAVVAALGCYTFYYNLYLLAAFFLTAAGLWRRDRTASRAAMSSTVVAGLLFAPWLLVLAGQSGALGGGWIQWDASPLRIVRRFAQVLCWAGGGDSLERGLLAIIPRLAGVGAAVIGLLWLAWGAWRLMRDGERDGRARWLLPTIAAIFTVLALGAHFVFGAFVAVHYFAVVAAAASPLLAASFVLARRRLAAGLLFGLVIAGNLVFFPAAANEGDEPLRDAAHWIDARLGDHDLVLGVAWFAADGYRWYGAGRRALGLPFDLRATEPVRRVQPGLMEATDLPPLRRTLSTTRRVALLLSHPNWQNADRGLALTTQALRAAGFALVAANGWPFGSARPSVSAEIWQR
jgi:hypothetical protein